MTTRVRLGTNILIAALRRPVVLAKTAATLDVLSVAASTSVSASAGSARSTKRPGSTSTRVVRHSSTPSRCVKPCGASSAPATTATGLHFEHIHQMPKPLQPGGVPIWVSGTINPRVVSRLARFGSGWIPWGPSAQDLATSIPQMCDELSKVGRDPSGLQVVGHLPLVKNDAGDVDLDRTMEGVPAFVDAGVTDFRATMKVPEERAALEDYLSKVVGGFRATVGRAAA